MRESMIAIIIILLLTLIPTASHARISGHVAMDYDTLNEDWLWTLSVDKHITSWWLVGTSMATYAPGYGFKHFVPSWIPHRLDYEVYTELRYKDLSLRIIDWCDHWFDQSGVDARGNDKYGLQIRLRYDF